MAAISFGWALIEVASVNALTEQRDALRATINSRAEARADAKKRECAQDAEQAFQKAGYSESAKDPNFAAETFTDHYSSKYDRCLIEILLTGKRGEDSRMIFDVHERKDFGDYYWTVSDTKKYWEQKPIQCRMARPQADETFCRSTAEWESYEREIMNS